MTISGTVPEKERLCVEILESATSFEDIEPALPIIQRYEHIYKYVPSINPIAEKNMPTITSNYGYRIHPQTKKYTFHYGIDLHAQYATTIHSTADGTVTFTGNRGGYGKCVIIIHNYGFSTLYAHLTEFYATSGSVVKKGDIIGFLGDTGNSTAEHLHYEIRKQDQCINPLKFLYQPISN